MALVFVRGVRLLRPTGLLACLVPVVVALGCGTSFTPSDADGGSGGAATDADGSESGGTTSDGPTDGSETGGATGSGGAMPTDAPEITGGSANSGGSESSGGAPGTGGDDGSGGGSGGGSGATGPCYDESCAGACEGSCDEGFVCNTESDVICAGVNTTVCGCDGETFVLPSACPTMGFEDYGECPSEGDGYDCNLDHIVCLPIVAPEPCPEGESYAVEGECYGECVPIVQCKCTSAADCPDPNDNDGYTCHNNTDRCGPWL